MRQLGPGVVMSVQRQSCDGMVNKPHAHPRVLSHRPISPTAHSLRNIHAIYVLQIDHRALSPSSSAGRKAPSGSSAVR